MLGDNPKNIEPTSKHYDLNDRETAADVLFVLGIIPRDKLVQLAKNVALIQKTVHFGKAFLRVSKGNVTRTGIYYEE